MNKISLSQFVPDKRDILRNSDLFGLLESSDIEHVASLAKERMFEDQEIIFEKETMTTSVWGVIFGEVKISIQLPNGVHELMLNTIKPGQIFGELSFLDGEKRSASATAVGDKNYHHKCKLFFIQRDDFRFLLERDASLAVRLLKVLCKRLRQTTEIANGLFSLKVPARIAWMLLKMASENAENAEQGHINKFKRVSQEAMSNMFGTTRESVNRQLRVWHRKGWIQIEKDYISITRIQELENFLDQELSKIGKFE